MSFWWFGKKKGGRRSLYSVNFPIHIIIPVLMILAFSLLGMIKGCH